MIFENSRYLHTPLYSSTNKDTPLLKMRERFKFNMSNCELHEWTEGDTLDGLAYRYYGVSALRWAILDANPSYRTEFDIEFGDRILIPNFDDVIDIVNV